ncbi:MAG: UDP-N-acetylmuramoyl-L-alanine--D-glutamate ligase [Deltaproteobacteria bacterium]|nr:MAG: UDP-N-acetylmuramoyl-L-alanine--D-glutamate ligase [Deltaproteobacteria bacterium]
MNFDLVGKRVCVMGLGASGRAAAKMCVEAGAYVSGLDLRDIVAPIPGVEMHLGPHDRQLLLDADLVVVSPGVPGTQPDILAAYEAGVPVIGELALAFTQLPRVPTVAITGTNGKSTVTWFTGQLLEAAGLRPFVGGNLGNPLSNGVTDGSDYDSAVLEVSSYQLEWRTGFEPDIGVILNLTPDHLARHGDMDGYARAKTRLFAGIGPNGWAVLPRGDERLRATAHMRGGRRAWLGDLPGVVRDGRDVHVRLPAGSAPAIDQHYDLTGVDLAGEHNFDNVATALLLTTALGADPARLQRALVGLRPLAHRMEVVGEVEGVRYINDSKATNVEATRVGLSGLDARAVVLLGGQAKGDAFSDLVPLLAEERATVTFGGSGAAIHAELKDAGHEAHAVDTMEEAVRLAATLAEPGDVVLLSPGCASFDAFDNFEHRGEVFRGLVASLAGELP